MSDKKPWRFSESRPIRPYKISEHALSKTAFRFRKDLEFSDSDPWLEIIEADEIKHERFAPSFKLSIDEERLVEEVGIEAKKLNCSIVARDPALLQSTMLSSWSVQETPEMYSVSSTDLSNMSGQRGIEFVVQISPSTNLPKTFRTASSPGDVVSSRSFRVDTPHDGAGFPVQPVAPEVFESLNLPKETVWVVNWNTSVDFDKPTEEILAVLINKDEAEKLLRLSSSDSVGRVLWNELAVEIFLEICLVVLSSEPDKPKERDSLLNKIVTKLNKDTGLGFDELVSKAKSNDDRFRFFRAHLQKDAELGKRIKAVSLAGRAS